MFCHFIEWLRTHNDIVGKNKTESEKVSIAGLDVYSLHRSADAVIEYLEKVDPKAADSARRQYDCFDKFGDDTMLYAFAARYYLTSVSYPHPSPLLPNDARVFWTMSSCNQINFPQVAKFPS